MLIYLHPSIQRFNQGLSHIQLDDCPVALLLDNIADKYPALKEILMDEHHHRQPYVNIYINKKSIDELDGEHCLSADDSIVIVSALVGG